MADHDDRDGDKEDEIAAMVHDAARALLIQHMQGKLPGEQAACLSGMACAIVETIWLGRKDGCEVPETLNTWMMLGRTFIEQAPAAWPDAIYKAAEPLRVQVVTRGDPKSRN